MKALPRRKGNALAQGLITQTPRRLNESPSQKEGKYFCFHRHAHSVDASMKAPPKRKGNLRWLVRACSANLTLNESPSEKEGKFAADLYGGGGNAPLNESPSEKEGKLPAHAPCHAEAGSLNESPSEKEGKCCSWWSVVFLLSASMKVPPKRKGNPDRRRS